MTRTPRPRSLLVAPLLAAIPLFLSACTGVPTPSTDGNASAAPAGVAATAPCSPITSMVLVVGVHQDVAAPGIPAELDCALTTAIRSRVPIAVIAVDGTPHVALARTVFPVLEDSVDNEAARNDDITAAKNAIIQATTTAIADANGSDLMTALSLAASLGQGDNPHIAVVDSGLTDTGSLRMTDPGMTAANPRAVAATLRSAGALPRLASTRLALVGFGWATDPQPQLVEAQRANVVALWSAVAEAAGAQVTVINLPRTGPGPKTAYTTKLVAKANEPTFAAPTVAKPAQRMTFNDNTVIRFQPGSATLTNSRAAADALTSAAAWLKGDPTHKVAITGTTSSEPPTAWPDNKALARARADAVRAVLVERLGVSAAQLTVVGAGYTANPPDGGPNQLNPTRAALNRAVNLTFTLD